MKNILEVENLYFSAATSNGQKEILKGIDLQVRESEVLGISGESGCGKTTLAKVLAGILKPVSGRISYNFSANNGSAKKVQMLFQNSDELLNPLLDVRKTLMLNGKPLNYDLCDLIGISQKMLSQRNSTLSGGERQKVAIARLLSVNPELLILDEPFSSQDPDSVKNLVELFKKINSNYKTALICISHQIKIFENFAHTISIMKNGKILETGNSAEILTSPAGKYTRFLLEAESYKLERRDFNDI